MDENAFSKENLKNKIFAEEYEFFPSGWHKLEGKIFNYCTKVVYDNPISSERIENFSSSFLSGDFRFYIDKFHYKKLGDNTNTGNEKSNKGDKSHKQPRNVSDKSTSSNIRHNSNLENDEKRELIQLHNKEYMKIFDEIAKPHFRLVEKNIQAWGISPYTMIFDEYYNPLYTSVPREDMGYIYTKWIKSLDKQYFCFVWNPIYVNRLSNICNIGSYGSNINKSISGYRVVNRNKTENGILDLKARIDPYMKFHVHPSFSPTITGRIRTPVSTTFNEYKNLIFYENKHRIMINRSMKTNAVFEKTYELDGKKLKEMIETKITYPDLDIVDGLNDMIRDNDDSNLGDLSREGNNCDTIKFKKSHLDKILECKKNLEENIIELSPGTQYKPLHLSQPNINILERRKIYNDHLSKVMKHPFSAMKIINELKMSGNITAFAMNIINNVKKEEEQGKQDIYSRFSTDLFRIMFNSFVVEKKKKIKEQYQNKKQSKNKTNENNDDNNNNNNNNNIDVNNDEDDNHNIETRNNSMNEVIDSAFNIKRILVKFPERNKRSNIDMASIVNLYEKKLISSEEFSDLMNSIFNIKTNKLESKNIQTKFERIRFQFSNYMRLFSEETIKESYFLDLIDNSIEGHIENLTLLKHYKEMFLKKKISPQKFCNLVLSIVQLDHSVDDNTVDIKENVDKMVDFNKSSLNEWQTDDSKMNE